MNDEANKNAVKRYNEPGRKGFLEGNPGGGRPKGSLSLTTILKKKLEELGKDKEGQELAKTNAELLIERIVGEAIAKGNDQQIKNILQYLEGMPRQPIDAKITSMPYDEDIEERIKELINEGKRRIKDPS